MITWRLLVIRLRNSSKSGSNKMIQLTMSKMRSNQIKINIITPSTQFPTLGSISASQYILYGLLSSCCLFYWLKILHNNSVPPPHNLKLLSLIISNISLRYIKLGLSLISTPLHPPSIIKFRLLSQNSIKKYSLFETQQSVHM